MLTEKQMILVKFILPISAHEDSLDLVELCYVTMRFPLRLYTYINISKLHEFEPLLGWGAS